MIKIPRLPWDEYFMFQAHVVATRSTCDRGPELLLDPGRHGVGAVIVKDHRIIASGYNGSPPGHSHCDDPETYMQCVICGGREKKYPDSNICSCGMGDTMEERHGDHIMKDNHCVRTIHSEMNAIIQCALDGTNPQDSTIYCTASPCYDCAKVLIRSGIIRVYYGEAYESRYGLSGSVKELLEQSGVKVESLVLEDLIKQQKGE